MRKLRAGVGLGGGRFRHIRGVMATEFIRLALESPWLGQGTGFSTSPLFTFGPHNMFLRL
jgi:hypothetical protein